MRQIDYFKALVHSFHTSVLRTLEILKQGPITKRLNVSVLDFH